MNYKLYLKRIGIPDDRPLSVNAETLSYLQQQHLLHVPFENIDIHNRIPFDLNVSVFYQKIVVNKRGGYCYECNGLFYELLNALGFEVRMISCRVLQRKKVGPEFDHLALIVTLDHHEWLVDVGFGDFSMKPVLLNDEIVHQDHPHSYKIKHYGNLDECQYLSASRWSKTKKRFVAVYIFTTKKHALADFSSMNHYHQTSPESHFTRSLICSMPTETGRISLINNRLIITDSDHKEEKLLYGPMAIEDALEKYFGMSNTSLVFAL